MMRYALWIATFTMLAANAFAEGQMWLKVDTANRRTCPSSTCGIVGKLFYREAATVYETRNGWGRITKYYDASCKDGRSEYVDNGNSDCSAENGIKNGQFAEWIRMDMLSKTRLPDPGANATGSEKLVAQSDDYQRYKSEFVHAAETLIASSRCTPKDFEEMGGFVKSANKGAGVYFTYCNNGADRIYLNVKTGKIFQ